MSDDVWRAVFSTKLSLYFLVDNKALMKITGFTSVMLIRVITVNSVSDGFRYCLKKLKPCYACLAFMMK
ncbi:MAG: hypothetical protein D4R63_01700 [Methylococcaceae bacterium]|jgi:hypothetical protein|nr:MAG: hypothetical protein D4R63_01700 [Methylococcaceae bacterium]